MLKGIIETIAINLGWDAALGFVAWLLHKGYIRIKIVLAKEHPLWKMASKIIEDGKINKAEVIKFLQEIDDHIPGKIDDFVVNVLVMALGLVDDFTWDQSDKVKLFAAIAKMIEDGVFENDEMGYVLDAVNEVTGFFKK